ncbi:MAG: AAC(3) family N-acetyltransferase [Oscillospiraceae bacterium]|nr:AAC(3) family N-acetyltransferase [Oscillospiraceae bacterium]
MFTKKALKKQLSQMGLKPTDTVVIHTSMKAIGEVESGPEGLIDAFCEYLNEGLLVVPTHTWDNVTPENPYYDVRTSVPNIGLIPRTAAFRKDGVRSLHPTHSVWACGKDAADYVKGEENAPSPTPKGFCWDKLADRHAKILLIGVGNEKNTFIHSIEERLALPDRISDKPYDITIINQEGETLIHPFYQQYCSKTEDISLFFGVFEKPMVEMGVQTFGKLGSAAVRIVDAMGCRELLTTIFTRSQEDIFAQHIDLQESLYK